LKSARKPRPQLPRVNSISIVSQPNIFRTARRQQNCRVQNTLNQRTSEAWPDNIEFINSGYSRVAWQQRNDDRHDANTALPSDIRNVSNSVHLYVSLRNSGTARTRQRPTDNDYYNCRFNFNDMTRDEDIRSDINATGYVNRFGSSENLLSSSNDASSVYTDVLTSSKTRPSRV
jgi:hypothetical protein